MYCIGGRFRSVHLSFASLSFSMSKVDEAQVEKADTNLTQSKANECIVTAVDIVEQQAALEREAQEVLPGKFEDCTFDKGYIRQGLYACKTCQKDGGDSKSERAGMCYSCSIACHTDHELIELFPKRNFRCDCGLPGKFGSNRCQLPSRQKIGIQKNEKNKYNHNFDGRYCRCDKTYDPEKEEGTMFQCVLCEDWFHEECIGEIPDDVEDFESYICRDCTDRFPFLIQYPSSYITLGLCTSNSKVHAWCKPSDITNENGNEKDVMAPTTSSESSYQAGQKRKAEDELSGDKKKPTAAANKCKQVSYPERVDMFLREGWRSELCRCDKCKAAYSTHAINFLLEEEETYEPEKDEDAGRSLEDIGMEQMMRMDRVKALESIIAYQTLASQIKDYLRAFRESGEVVTEADIRRFFADRRRE
ncbi:hypothetical protein BX666DRAFT_1962790 [Dichotomocladium elegans]|nr:hypothetical protein BX666DRAFT_1962790 [Dichotomocladium elegans]